MKKTGKYAARCVQQHRRSRIIRVRRSLWNFLRSFSPVPLQKRKSRKASLAKSTTMTSEQKKKWMVCLTPELISSEESEDEDPATFVVHPLAWRSD